jgi:glycerol-3-phosphate dehydrogenase
MKVKQNRNELWNALAQKQWDIVVVGGGITGAGIFRQAAKLGYKTLLIEQQDFAWGTSSRSSKMVHGGFRYIAQGDIQLTKEALHEREQMLKEVPGLVDRMQFVFPLRKGRFPGRFSLGVLLKVYDLLAGVNDSAYIKNEELGEQVKGIDIPNMKGAIAYSDAITDDSRLVMRVIQEGKAYGGVALNYVKAKEIIHSSDGQLIESMMFEDQESNAYKKVSSKVFINATGAWADNLMESSSDDKKIRPLRGSHIILKADKFELKNALTLVHPDDGRPIFMFPWYGRILLGTTDLDYPENLDKEAVITQKELDYLLKVVNEFFPNSKSNQEDIVGSFCGVRPVISSGKGVDPSKEKRGHSIWQKENLISVSGGKLTIWRVIADEVLEKVQKLTKNTNKHSFDTMFNQQNIIEDKHARLSQLRVEYRHILLGRYGTQLKDFLLAFDESDYQEYSSFCFSLADCRWAIQEEQVRHLDDLLFRRTRLGLLQDSSELINQFADLLQAELQWSDQVKEKEIKRYHFIKNSFYRLPPS